MVEHWLRSRWGEARWLRHTIARVLLGLLTFGLVSLTWVFFRAPDFGTAWRLLGSMLGAHASGDQILMTLDVMTVLIVTGGLLAVHWGLRETRLDVCLARLPWWVVNLIWTGMLGAIAFTQLFLTQGRIDPFIYFVF